MSIVADFVQIRSLDEISDSFCPTFVCSDASLYHSNLTISPTIGEKNYCIDHANNSHNFGET